MSRRGIDWIFVVSGLLLTVAAVFPVARWVRADDSGPPWADYVTSWGLGVLVVSVLGIAAGRYLAAWRPALPRLETRAVLAVLALAATIGSAAVAFYSFSGNPHLVDEMAQLFQARAYAAGMLAAPTPELPSFFQLPNTFVTESGWISQYPPGGSALLALGTLAGFPWLINPVLCGVGVLLVFRVARSLYDEPTAIVAALLWTTSAWVLSMSGTYMNHVGATTFALLAWALTLGRPAVGKGALLATGLAIAICASIRPLDGVIASVPLLAWWAGSDRKSRNALLACIGGIPVLAVWGWVNWRTMGSPLAMGYLENFGPEHGLGFHMDPFGQLFTLADGLANMSSAVRRLNIYLFEWPIPATLPLLIWLVLGKSRGHSDLIVLSGLITAPVVYLCYFHSGFHPGPRFLYIAAPFFVIGTARSVLWMMMALPPGREVRWKTAFVGCAVATFVWGALALTPQRLSLYRASLSNLKIHPREELVRGGEERALVLVPESWGSRVMARLWGAGVPSGLSERAYRSLDLCDLDSIVTALEPMGGAAIEVALEARLAAGITPAPLVPDAPDPTLRLRSIAGLPQGCVRELRRDLAGFTPYAIVGWQNDPRLEGDIVFARDMFERNGPLLARYPDRQLWRLAPPRGFPDSLPRLERIDNAGN